MVKAVLLRPLDGLGAEGSIVELSQAGFDRLKARGAVKAAPAPANKKAAEPANKAGGGSAKK